MSTPLFPTEWSHQWVWLNKSLTSFSPKKKVFIFQSLWELIMSKLWKIRAKHLSHPQNLPAPAPVIGRNRLDALNDSSASAAVKVSRLLFFEKLVKSSAGSSAIDVVWSDSICHLLFLCHWDILIFGWLRKYSWISCCTLTHTHKLSDTLFFRSAWQNLKILYKYLHVSTFVTISFS